MKPAITPQHATAHPHTNQHLWKVRRSHAVATVHCGVVIYTSGQIEKLFNRFISNELISHWSLSHLPLSTCYCVQLLLPAVPSLPFSLLVDWTILDSNNKLKKKKSWHYPFSFFNVSELSLCYEITAKYYKHDITKSQKWLKETAGILTSLCVHGWVIYVYQNIKLRNAALPSVHSS